MDGSKGYPGARYVRLIKGAVDVEKGAAKEISGLKKIDDYTLEMTITEQVEPGFLFFAGTTSILPKEEVAEGELRHQAGRPRARSSSRSTFRARAWSLERFDKFYKPGKPYARQARCARSWREAAARDVAFRNKEIDTSILGPAQYVAYRADPQLSEGHPGSRRGVHPLRWA